MGFAQDLCNAFIPGSTLCDEPSPSPSNENEPTLTEPTDNRIPCGTWKTLRLPITADQLKNFDTNRDCRPSGTRSAREELEDWIEEKRDEYCNSSAVFYAMDPGGGKTC